MRSRFLEYDFILLAGSNEKFLGKVDKMLNQMLQIVHLFMNTERNE